MSGNSVDVIMWHQRGLSSRECPVPPGEGCKGPVKRGGGLSMCSHEDSPLSACVTYKNSDRGGGRRAHRWVQQGSLAWPKDRSCYQLSWLIATRLMLSRNTCSVVPEAKQGSCGFWAYWVVVWLHFTREKISCMPTGQAGGVSILS